MESEETENIEKEYSKLTVDLSKHSLKRIERVSGDQEQPLVLIADDNEIQRLDNLDSYTKLQKLSLVNNQLIRMYGVSHLIYLEELNLSNNSLVTIEGLKDLKALKQLNLSRNKIKTIEHLISNVQLEKLDLSDNFIGHISDISYLVNLKELYLHGNKVSLLRNCEKNLPGNLEVLTLNNNAICDLNEVSYLAPLTSLKELSFGSNPCVDLANDQNGLGIVFNSLKAEWLYSQGRGRSFRPGEHAALAEYLTNVCPRKAEQNADEDVKKLKLILSKAQLHQRQLREQLSTGKLCIPEPNKSLVTKKKSTCSERMVTSFQESPSKDSKYSPDLMTRSLDSGVFKNSPSSKSIRDVNQTPLQTSTTFIPVPDTLISPETCQFVQPFTPSHRPSSLSSRTSRSSSRNSPHSTPESKRRTGAFQKQNNCSPVLKKVEKSINIRSSTPLQKRSCSTNAPSPMERGSNRKSMGRSQKETSEDEESEILAMQVLAVQQRSPQKMLNKKFNADTKKRTSEEKENVKLRIIENLYADAQAWKAAVCIQKWWRGYRTRNLNREVIAVCKDIQLSRMQEYITKLVHDMEATKVALEGNRKLQILQMQAINALWKKMTALQPTEAVENSSESKISLQHLIETCSNLNKQVEGLQAMVRAMQSSGNSSLIPIGTQTEIIAVHTPQGENKNDFPYNLQNATSKETLISNELPKSPPPCEIENKNSSSKLLEKDLDTSLVTLKGPTNLYTNIALKEPSSSENTSISEMGDLKEEKSLFEEDLSKPSIKLNETSSSLTVSEAPNSGVESINQPVTS